MEYFVLIHIYVHSSYIPTEKKGSSAQREGHSLGRKEGLRYSEGLPSLWLQDTSLFLPTHSGSLSRRGMAKLGRYLRRQSSSQSEFCGSRFHSSCEKTKSDSICPGNNLTFTRAISNNFSSHLHRHSVKKAETQQCARTQVNSKKCSDPSYRSRW